MINVNVPNQQIALLYSDGDFVKVLQPGRYGFWNYNRVVSAQLFDLKLQSTEISGQEILTKDRVSLRINLNASYKIVEPRKAAESVSNLSDYIYRRLQLALREVIGTKTLDELLADKNVVSTIIQKQCQSRLAEIGVELESVGVRDIILPGEMKEILNQVVQAQKAAEANVIKRREETAATRSLQNTAKVMEGNPTLLRLKELEVLEKVAERIDRITVLGGLDSVLKDMVTLTPPAK
jgi:regulator of protease activity HflC (stomatin/prohibitin superfamily)